MNFLEEDITLTIGLPLISEMTTAELTSLMSNVFGHLTDKYTISINYIITGINRWFERGAYEQDEIDLRMDVLSRISENMFQLLLSIAKFFIWLTRNIMKVFVIIGHTISKQYVRQSEFEADRYAARLAGCEAFESSLRKQNITEAALKDALTDLKTQRKPDDNSLPDNFVSSGLFYS